MAPNLKRTWAPKGHTPVIQQVTRSYRKVSAMGAIAVTPRFKRARIFFRLLEGKNFNTDACISFVEQLKQNIRGQIRLVWDRLLAHRSRKMMKYLSRQNRVAVVYLPAYAPELNPTEYLWSYLKEQTMCNRAHLNLRSLFLDAKLNLCEIRRDRSLAKQFVRHSALSGVWRL